MCKASEIKRYEQIEVPIVVGAPTKVMFPDLPNLRSQADQSITIKDMEVIAATVMPATPNGATNAPLTELQKAVIVLYNKGEEMIYRVPVLKLNRINDGGTTPFQEFFQEFGDLSQVDWSKSYILFSSAPANTPYSFLFGVNYLKFPK